MRKDTSVKSILRQVDGNRMTPNNWIPRVGDKFTYPGYTATMTVTGLLRGNQITTIDKGPDGSETNNSWMYGQTYENEWIPRKKTIVLIKVNP